jgi:hypothetical protein
MTQTKVRLLARNAFDLHKLTNPFSTAALLSVLMYFEIYIAHLPLFWFVLKLYITLLLFLACWNSSYFLREIQGGATLSGYIKKLRTQFGSEGAALGFSFAMPLMRTALMIFFNMTVKKLASPAATSVAAFALNLWLSLVMRFVVVESGVLTSMLLSAVSMAAVEAALFYALIKFEQEKFYWEKVCASQYLLSDIRGEMVAIL